MKNIANILLFFIINSCTINGQELKLKGKIALENNDTCTIYSDRDTTNFKLLNENGKHLNSLVWLNNKDVFIAAENIKTQDRKSLKSNLVLLDIKGQIIERIYESSKNEFINNSYPSPGDNLLVLTTRFWNKNDPDNIFDAPLTIRVMDLKSKRIIRQMDNFCPRINFGLMESPWSPDEKDFVYSISEERKMVTNGEKAKIHFVPKNGIYIYNIEKNAHKQIAETGTNAVWSPKGDFIAYLVKGEIWLYNLAQSNSTRLYKSDTNEHASDIHWTPDGEYLYFTCTKDNLNQHMLYAYNEKLIKILDGKLVNFQKINKGTIWYTWKK